jgi:hypothetical protein
VSLGGAGEREALVEDRRELAGGDGGERARRIEVSGGWTPDALTSTRTWGGAGLGIVDLLPAQVVGRAELVQSDRVHGGDRRTSSGLEVKELRGTRAHGMLEGVTHRLDTPLLALALPGGLRGVRVAG